MRKLRLKVGNLEVPTPPTGQEKATRFTRPSVKDQFDRKRTCKFKTS